MSLGFLQFKEALFQQGIFSANHIRLLFPDFNSDNLLYWQKKGYIFRLRNKWYCFREFTTIADFHYLVANTIYAPSYISHQEALLFYGLVPEHIVDSVSVTTKKTASFSILNRTYQYYSISPKYFFGYDLKEMRVNGMIRNFLIADREKAILDFLYIYNFYKKEQDISEIRFNEIVLESEVDWKKMDNYLERFNNKALAKRIRLIQKVYHL
jgi:predicted transcriptional regulator of viral defense system